MSGSKSEKMAEKIGFMGPALPRMPRLTVLRTQTRYPVCQSAGIKCSKKKKIDGIFIVLHMLGQLLNFVMLMIAKGWDGSGQKMKKNDMDSTDLIHRIENTMGVETDEWKGRPNILISEINKQIQI